MIKKSGVLDDFNNRDIKTKSTRTEHFSGASQRNVSFRITMHRNGGFEMKFP